MPRSIVVILLPLLYFVIPIHSCKIHGTESGVCSYRYLPSTYQNGIRSDLEAITIANQNWAKETDGACKNGEGAHCMPFCGRYIASYYPPCVPKATRDKDRWVEEQVTAIIERRIGLEKRKEAKKRFMKNKACQDAYKRYFCWVNFPRCDEFEETLPMCQSVCENFFRVCGYDNDLWMCQNNMIDNGDDMEAERKSNPSVEEKSSYFPGEPFKENEYEKQKGKNVPKDICTPSIKGNASQLQLSGIAIFLTIAMVGVQALL